ncbi:hypothetical protein [Kineococcus sp. SYSU DK004]|uniref:hypothetical protein n=1 Tax=Kineococcus sp. SYSU DK004 TaxID=3383125 RepID=UPI003D7E6D2A
MTPLPAAPDHVRLAVTAGEDATAQVRRFVRLFAQQSGVDGEVADDLVQAAAELLAVGDTVEQVRAVEVRETGAGIVVVVDLAGRDTPHLAAEADALLSGLTREWGWRRTPDALRVWCEVAAPA